MTAHSEPITKIASPGRGEFTVHAWRWKSSGGWFHVTLGTYPAWKDAEARCHSVLAQLSRQEVQTLHVSNAALPGMVWLFGSQRWVTKELAARKLPKGLPVNW